MIHGLDPRADRAAVVDLVRRAADYVEMESGPMPPADWARGHFEAALPPGADRASERHLGLWAGGRLDGLASTIRGYPEASDAYLGLLLLAPEARGRGEGARLLARVEAEARGRGAVRLLVAVLDANARGRAFWDREGFSEVARFAGRTYGARTHDVARLAKPL